MAKAAKKTVKKVAKKPVKPDVWKLIEKYEREQMRLACDRISIIGILKDRVIDTSTGVENCISADTFGSCFVVDSAGQRVENEKMFRALGDLADFIAVHGLKNESVTWVRGIGWF